MNRSVRLAFAFCGLAGSWAVSRPALAQGADALPALDEAPPQPQEYPAPELPPAPPPPILLEAPAPKRPVPRGPIRAQRRLALLGEIGWNGIAGFGPNLTFNADPHLAFDLGAGLSLLGWKVGLRTRYNFLTGPVTPFLGVGVMGAAGFGDSPIPINQNADPTRETVNIKILPSAWLQTVGGIDWVSPSGFTLISTIGYASLLSHDPVQVVTGVPNADERQGFDVAFRSNLVVTTAIGYSFR